MKPRALVQKAEELGVDLDRLDAAKDKAAVVAMIMELPLPAEVGGEPEPESARESDETERSPASHVVTPPKPATEKQGDKTRETESPPKERSTSPLSVPNSPGSDGAGTGKGKLTDAADRGTEKDTQRDTERDSEPAAASAK